MDRDRGSPPKCAPPRSPPPPRMSPQLLSYQSPFPSTAVRSRFTEAPCRPRPLPNPRPSLPPEDRWANLHCPHLPASLPLRTRSPHPRLCSTCGRAVWTPERSGIKGNAPPRKVGVPTPGRAHMSLAGRFFPSTMRMDSELRLAIVGPRLRVPAGGVGRQGPAQRAAGGRARAGLGAQGAGRVGPWGAGGLLRGRRNRFHFIHPRPRPTCGGHCTQAGQSAAGAGSGCGAYWPPGAGWGGASAEALTPGGRGGARGAPPGDGLRPVAGATDSCGRRAWPECQPQGAGGCGIGVLGGVGMCGDTRVGGVRGGPPWPPEAGAWVGGPALVSVQGTVGRL